MATKVLLEINGEKVNREIEGVRVKQTKQALKKIKEVFKYIEENRNVAEMVDYLLETAEKVEEEVKAEEEDKKFMEMMIKSFDVLLEEVPEKAVELISVLSGIEEEVLDEQKVDTFFDIFDAILEENDITKLVDRGKKSLSNLKMKIAVQRQQKEQVVN